MNASCKTYLYIQYLYSWLLTKSFSPSSSCSTTKRTQCIKKEIKDRRFIIIIIVLYSLPDRWSRKWVDSKQEKGNAAHNSLLLLEKICIANPITHCFVFHIHNTSEPKNRKQKKKRAKNQLTTCRNFELNKVNKFNQISSYKWSIISQNSPKATHLSISA